MSDEVKNAIKSIFVNPVTASKAVDMLVHSHKKPQGWSRRSNAPYYKERYALQLKEVLDAMIEDHQVRLYRYSEWPGMSPQSLYLRINQSIRYLCDCMDTPEHKYARFCETLVLSRERNIGVRIEIRNGLETSDHVFAPSSVVPQYEAPRWRQKIETWLEEAEPEHGPLLIENLMLSPDEVRELKLQFAGLQNVQVSITATTIKLLKVNL